MKFSKKSLSQQTESEGMTFLLPALLVIFVITALPVIFTFVLSFADVQIFDPIPRHFVWFDNYLKFVNDQTFWQSIWRTAYFTFVSVGLELVLGLAIASLINAKPFGWQFIRASLIIPWAIPTIVNGAIWRWIYNADYGALNALLYSFGLIDKYQVWLSNAFVSLNLVILADVWHSVPFIALILQAALSTIPVEVEEASMVDGANVWQRFFRIRLPLLRPAILVALVVRTVEAFRVFDIIYVITQGGPAFGTVTISYLTYLESFKYGRLGSGSALSFLISAFTLVMALVYIRILYKPETVE